MDRVWRRVPGNTLAPGKGVAVLRGEGLGYTVRRATVTVAAIAGLLGGVAGTAAALQGEADPGVSLEAPGGHVQQALPTGFAWWAGVRAGQTVVSLAPASDPNGWQLTTSDGARTFTVRAAPFDEALSDSAALGAFAIVLGSLALLFVRTRRAWVAPAAAWALVAASTPLGVGGNPQLSTVGLALAFLVPAGWLAVNAPARQARPWIAAAAVLFVGVWVWTRLSPSDLFAELEPVRALAAVAGAIALVGLRVGMPAISGEPIHMTRPRLIDVAAIGVLASVALGLVYFLSVSPLAIGALLALVFAALIPVGRHFERPLRNALLADVRSEARAEGAEDERARLAHDLHDVPLQEIVGIIRRLEVLPGAESESDDLRAVATHLRNVAAELRPPVLDDLGLPAGLAHVADELKTPGIAIVLDLDDHTGFARETRPPADVELAMYRIAHEAIGNAIHHAHPTKVLIRAHVDPSRVAMAIEDDGVGFDPGRAGTARDDKHLGLVSIRRRAEAIDGELSIEPSPRGTAVRVVWRK